MSIYKDYPHLIKVRSKGNSQFIKKKTADTKIHKKEFLLQKFLSSRVPTVPRVWNYSKDFFYEEYINGYNFNNLPVSKRNKALPEIAKLIRQIHDIDADSIKPKLFVKRPEKYSPLYVLDLIAESEIHTVKNHLDYQKIKSLAHRSEKFLKSVNYNLSIIHGDLSGNNIIVNGNSLKFVDWTDARLDLGLCDIVQFIYLAKLNKSQENILLANYGSPLANPLLVKLLKTYLLLYDYVAFYKNTKRISHDLINDIKKILDE